MPEATTIREEQRMKLIRYRGRRSQILIYLGKFLRMFVYQNDWKVLPMAAVIAGLVAMVVKNMFFISMEGTLMAAFALTCVGIWNGCFNSIQVICRERDVIKREHRAGMHISSYIIAHLIYQGMLCLLQTVITLYVFRVVGVRFPEEGLFTRWMIADLGISLFLITCAADTLALWISSLARNTTTAMTIMPFVLIFQLVFSGWMLQLPEWSKPLNELTISHYGLTALASQADYNSRPLVALWGSVSKLRGTDLSLSFTVGQALDYLSDENNPGVKDIRETAFDRSYTVRELTELLPESDARTLMAALFEKDSILSSLGDEQVSVDSTFGEVLDYLAASPLLEGERQNKLSVNTTVGEVIDYLGEDKVHWEVQQAATAANYNPAYEHSQENITSCWLSLLLMTVVCALLATITLEFIDKDKR